MLASTQQFQVIFYNHDVTVFNPNPGLAPRLMFADDGTKDLAEQFIRALPATGGTEHVEALRRALLLGPDVIFFLTDAEDPQLTARQLEQLRRLNRGSVIHAIEFGTGPPSGGDNFLMRLARQNNGQHTYVMPRETHPGGYYVLAQGLAARGQHQRAALAWLRTALLYPEQDRGLAAQALLNAGRELERIENHLEAASLYREIVRDYARTPAADQATARLESLGGTTSSH
jgi:tetratricopeptide (TPR) repeat protein